MYQLGDWAWSPHHGQLCQVIEAQTRWGETTCRVWLKTHKRGSRDRRTQRKNRVDRSTKRSSRNIKTALPSSTGKRTMHLLHAEG